MDYTPEKPFQISSDNSIVYNLRHHGWRKGEETFENDIAVIIEMRDHSPELKAKIAKIIQVTLNRELVIPADTASSRTQ